MKQPEFEFCMKEFKLAIAVLAVFIVAVLIWSIATFHKQQLSRRQVFTLAAARTVTSAPDIRVTDPMIHNYRGNCNQCHLTVRIPPVIQNRSGHGLPISVTAAMPHKYRGNCNACHPIHGGIAPQFSTPGTRVAALGSGIGRFPELGLEIRDPVAAGSTPGGIVTSVTPGSPAAAAGFRPGDEIIRLDNTKVGSVMEFTRVLDGGSGIVKATVIRELRNKNIYMRLPGTIQATAGNGSVPAQARLQTRPGASLPGPGKVAVAAMGPGLTDSVAPGFARSPYFILWDPGTGQYRSMVNPNYTDTLGNAGQTAQLMVDLGVANVIAGGFSGQSISALGQLHLTPYAGGTGQAGEVLAHYRAGGLLPLNLPVAGPRTVPPAAGKGIMF